LIIYDNDSKDPNKEIVHPEVRSVSHKITFFMKILDKLDIICFSAAPIRGLGNEYRNDEGVSSGNITNSTRLDSPGGWVPDDMDPQPFLEVI